MTRQFQAPVTHVERIYEPGEVINLCGRDILVTRCTVVQDYEDEVPIMHVRGEYHKGTTYRGFDRTPEEVEESVRELLGTQL